MFFCDTCIEYPKLNFYFTTMSQINFCKFISKEYLRIFRHQLSGLSFKQYVIQEIIRLDKDTALDCYVQEKRAQVLIRKPS
jgi:hypothetical protein